MKLKEFLYLDKSLISQFLSQFDGGEIREERLSQSDAKAKSGGGKASIAGIGGELSSQSTSEKISETIIKRTPEADFKRLEDALKLDDISKSSDAFIKSFWKSKTRGDILSIEGVVSIPELFQAFFMVGKIEGLVPLMKAFGEEVDPEMQEALDMMKLVQGAITDIPIIIKSHGNSEFKYICQIKPEYIYKSIDDISGECVVIGVMQRLLDNEENYSIMDSFGLTNIVPQEDLKKTVNELKNDDPDSVISSPAAIIIPIAVYR